MSAHETYDRESRHQGGTNRNFGLVFAVFFLIVAAYPALRGRPVRVWALPVAAAFLVAALAAPGMLGPLNRVWTLVGFALSRVTNVILLSFLFYGVFTPAGWWMRVRGRDALRRRFDKSLDSYWIPRQPPGPAPGDMARQF